MILAILVPLIQSFLQHYKSFMLKDRELVLTVLLLNDGEQFGSVWSLKGL